MKNILLFGDSNTYGYKPDGSGRFDETVRWSAQVRDYFKEKGIHVIEEGLCGRTTVFEDELRPYRRGADILPVLLESHSPLDLVVIMLGTNDCKTRYQASPEVIAKGMELLAGQTEKIKGKKNPVVLLVSPIALGENIGTEGFDPEFDKHSIQVSKGLPEAYRKVAEKGGYEFLAASDYANASSVDCEHLDERGHAYLAAAMIQKLEQILFSTQEKHIA